MEHQHLVRYSTNLLSAAFSAKRECVSDRICPAEADSLQHSPKLSLKVQSQSRHHWHKR